MLSCKSRSLWSKLDCLKSSPTPCVFIAAGKTPEYYQLHHLLRLFPETGVSSRAPRFHALNACAIRQAHSRGNLASTVCCFGKPCPSTRLQRNVRAGIVSRTPRRRALARVYGAPSSYGSSGWAKTRSQSVDRSSLHTFGAVWMKLQPLEEVARTRTALHDRHLCRHDR